MSKKNRNALIEEMRAIADRAARRAVRDHEYKERAAVRAQVRHELEERKLQQKITAGANAAIDQYVEQRAEADGRRRKSADDVREIVKLAIEAAESAAVASFVARGKAQASEQSVVGFLPENNFDRGRDGCHDLGNEFILLFQEHSDCDSIGLNLRVVGLECSFVLCGEAAQLFDHIHKGCCCRVSHKTSPLRSGLCGGAQSSPTLTVAETGCACQGAASGAGGPSAAPASQTSECGAL